MSVALVALLGRYGCNSACGDQDWGYAPAKRRLSALWALLRRENRGCSHTLARRLSLFENRIVRPLNVPAADSGTLQTRARLAKWLLQSFKIPIR